MSNIAPWSMVASPSGSSVSMTPPSPPLLVRGGLETGIVSVGLTVWRQWFFFNHLLRVTAQAGLSKHGHRTHVLKYLIDLRPVTFLEQRAISISFRVLMACLQHVVNALGQFYELVAIKVPGLNFEGFVVYLHCLRLQSSTSQQFRKMPRIPTRHDGGVRGRGSGLVNS